MSEPCRKPCPTHTVCPQDQQPPLTVDPPSNATVESRFPPEPNCKLHAQAMTEELGRALARVAELEAVVEDFVRGVRKIQDHVEAGGANEELTAATVECSRLLEPFRGRPDKPPVGYCKEPDCDGH